MPCAECEAFEAAYRIARDHYAGIASSFHKMPVAPTSEYRKLKLQVEVARDARLMAKEALRVHKEGHRKH